MPSRPLEPAEESGSETSARPFWSGTITFGLVSIPVDLYPANRSGGAPLRMLGPEGRPLRRRYHPENSERPLDDDQIVRGYEYEKDHFVVVKDEELERLAPEKTRDIELKRFVPAADVDPLYFERGYYLAPAGKSSKAYELLAAAMAESKRAGLATFVMRAKEYLIAIFSERGVLRAETLRFADELRSPGAAGVPGHRKVPAETLEAFVQIVRRSTKRSLPTKELVDEQAKKLVELARRKKAHKQDVVEVDLSDEAGGGGEVIDLMSVLKSSLERSTPRRGKKKRAA